MLGLDDSRWASLKGGYKTRFDPRPQLVRLETGQDIATVWHELWGELHHQGNVGDASYAVVPHVVRIHRTRGVADWNTYAMVAVIELARTKRDNPELPAWLEQDYFRAITELAEIGAAEILRTREPANPRPFAPSLASLPFPRASGRMGGS
jgi:hypothetical protein